ncbi:hypothetical protein BVRB_1g013850 [Beta vulgaris subsp. vulgaris]|nr:hypothetical protein BVRB_1g013850 [Beta vulgaris subsp. vulgaris]
MASGANKSDDKMSSNMDKDKGRKEATLDDGTPKIQCFKCKGYGHYKRQCPTARVLSLRDVREIEDFQNDRKDEVDSDQECKPESSDEEEEGQNNLVLRRVLHSKSVDESQRENIFHTRCKVNDSTSVIMSKKKGKADLSPVKFTFARSNPDEEKDTFDRSTKNDKVIFNKFTIRDVLGLPVSDKSVEVIDDDAFRRKGSQVEAGSARRDWHRLLDVSDPKKPYIKYNNEEERVGTEESGIHNFKCRNLDFSNVSKPFITYWQEDKHLSSVVKQFEINMDFILLVKREKEKKKYGSRVLEFKAPSEYVKNMHKLKRNALAFCQVNLEIEQNIREEGEKLSQDSLSLDDSEVFNQEFLNQIDDICMCHLAAKESANKVDPTITPLVKWNAHFELERNEIAHDLDAGVHGDEEKGGNDEKEQKEDNDKETKKQQDDNDDYDVGLQGDEEKGGNKDYGDNDEKEPKEDDKTRNADDDQLKEVKDKDKSVTHDSSLQKSSCEKQIVDSTPIRTPTAAVEVVDLSTPPPIVEVVENVYSRRSSKVDSSGKGKKKSDYVRLLRRQRPVGGPDSGPAFKSADPSCPSFQLLTPTPIGEGVGCVDSAESGESVGSSIPIITPVKVKYPRDDDLDKLIDKIAKYGVDYEEPKKEEDEKKDIRDVAGVGSSSAPGLQAIPVNNHGLILCRSLQQCNKYLNDLSPENVLLVDYLFYNEFDDVSRLSLDPNFEPTKTKNLMLQDELQSDIIVDFENHDSNYSVQLYKFDLVSMPRHGWFTSGVIDGCAYMFNRQEEESPSATRF